jgi:hypothetical protein
VSDATGLGLLEVLVLDALERALAALESCG